MLKAEVITSAANPMLKDVRKAIVKGTLTEHGCCVAETFHLLEEALRSDCQVETVLAAESARPAVETHLNGLKRVRLVVLADNLFQSLSGTGTSQGVMALVRPPEWQLEDVFRGCPLVVVLDGLQDPGNAGTIARTAEAFGASGLLFLKGTVNPFNAKTLRASAGSLFRLPFLHSVDAPAARSALRQHRVEVYATVPARKDAPGPQPETVDLTRACALVIGSEGRGIGEQMRLAALDISIPTTGVESLNAAVAAGILLYEARRQRSRRQ